ncbi:MAG: hypothetical protein B6I26_02925 [Desulfobacteraceae bacterium 4572_130]|nr:MAG: hypothetical protein B6I26_02925 [Desulfobacteraceae bacterium 4572_130]
MDNFSSREIEEKKRAIFNAMGKRGKKQIEKIGYENWDPIQNPKDPIDIRTDETKHTSQQLISKFLRQTSHEDYSNAFAQGAFEMCLGIINNEEKIKGMLKFSKWYEKFLNDHNKN